MNTERTIRNVMSTDLITVKKDATFMQMKDIFNDNNFHHLLVVDDDKTLLGIVSVEDLWKVAYRLSFITTGKVYSEKSYAHYLAEAIMTKNPITIAPDDTLGLAAGLFRTNRFRALPVVDGTELVGIVTPYDLVGFAFKDASLTQ